MMNFRFNCRLLRKVNFKSVELIIIIIIQVFILFIRTNVHQCKFCHIELGLRFWHSLCLLLLYFRLMVFHHNAFLFSYRNHNFVTFLYLRFLLFYSFTVTAGHDSHAFFLMFIFRLRLGLIMFRFRHNDRKVFSRLWV